MANCQRKDGAMKRLKYIFIIISLLGLASCQQKTLELVPEIINTYPHDSNAFTQGLLFANNKLYESTGLRGRSSLREVELKTGKVVRSLDIDKQYFAEGLAHVNNKLYQITWQSKKAFVYDLDTFNLEKTFSYNTEGWGICFDGKDLYMSDGTSTIYKRDPKDFKILSQYKIKLDNKEIDYLNELECVDSYIYANIWQTNKILKINKQSGQVVAEIDASNLLKASGASQDPNAVLNGIAYNPRSKNFYLTGKLWPKLFEVSFKSK